MFNLARGSNRVAQLSEQIASGKRVIRATDDASSFSTAKSLRTTLDRVHQFQKNIGVSNDRLAVAESAMASMKQILDRAKEISLAMANGSVTVLTRANAGTEMQHLIDEMVGLGNTQLNGRYLFGGSQTQAPPFDAAGVYSGDGSVQRVPVGEGITVAANTPGDTLLTGAGAGGGIDILATLTQLRDDLNANNVTGIQAAIDTTGAAAEQVTRARMGVGLQLNKLETRATNLDEVAFQSERILSQTEDLDMASAVSELVLRQNTLEVTRSVLGQILSGTSLLNFLR